MTQTFYRPGDVVLVRAVVGGHATFPRASIAYHDIGMESLDVARVEKFAFEVGDRVSSPATGDATILCIWPDGELAWVKPRAADRDPITIRVSDMVRLPNQDDEPGVDWETPPAPPAHDHTMADEAERIRKADDIAFTFVRDVGPEDWIPLPQNFKEGDTVYRFTGHTFGLDRDDQTFGRIETVACTLEIGSESFFTVPVSFLWTHNGQHPVGAYQAYQDLSKVEASKLGATMPQDDGGQAELARIIAGAKDDEMPF